MSKSKEEIRQKIKLAASPQAVYEAIMDSRLHTEFTGTAADVSRKIGEVFHAADGWIEGINLDLEPGKRIVQAWRGADWPKGSWSVATFDLEKLPGGRTLLTLTHQGVPTQFIDDIREGWHAHYWRPMRSWLGDMGESGREALTRGRAALHRVTGGRLGRAASKKKVAKKAASKKKVAKKATSKKKVAKQASKKATKKKATKKKATKKKATKKKATKKKATKKKATAKKKVAKQASKKATKKKATSKKKVAKKATKKK